MAEGEVFTVAHESLWFFQFASFAAGYEEFAKFLRPFGAIVMVPPDGVEGDSRLFKWFGGFEPFFESFGHLPVLTVGKVSALNNEVNLVIDECLVEDADVVKCNAFTPGKMGRGIMSVSHNSEFPGSFGMKCVAERKDDSQKE